MTCRHFDELGLLRAERGEPDPHLEGCAECQARHADYAALRAALADTGAAHVPPAGWEARVLAAIDRAPAPPARRRTWWIAGGALAAAAAAIVVWQVGRARGPDAPAEVASFEVIHHGAVVRGDAPAVGDGLRAVNPGDRAAIWIYRDERLVLACSRVESPSSTGNPDGTCTLRAQAVAAELDGLRAGSYQLVSLQTELRAPATLDAAEALLHRGRIAFTTRGFVVE